MPDKIPKDVDERMAESRVLVRKALDAAMGVYVEQESKKTDSWRDTNWDDLIQHLKHEIHEIQYSHSLTAQLHNALDATALAAILVAKIIVEEDEAKKR